MINQNLAQKLQKTDLQTKKQFVKSLIIGKNKEAQEWLIIMGMI